MGALVTTVAVAPFDLALPPDGWTQLRLRPLMLAVLAVSAWVIARHGVRRVGRLDILVGAWVAVMWLSVAFSVAPALGSAAAMRITAFALLVVAIARVVRTEADERLLLRAAATGLVVACAVGLLVHVAGREILGTEHLVGAISGRESSPRFTRPWSNSNVAAMAIGATLPATFLVRRGWRAPTVALGVVAVVLTYSRAAALAVLAAGAVTLLVRRTRADIVPAVALTLLVAVTALVPPGWAGRLDGREVRDFAVGVPPRIVLDPNGTTVPVTVTNRGSVTWPARTAELTAHWLGVDQQWSWGEHRWPLPEVAPGATISITLDLEASIPAGTFDVEWGLSGQPRVRYVGIDSTTESTRGIVFESAVTAADVVPTFVVRRGVALERPEIWGVAVREFLDAPLLGVGPGELAVAADHVAPDRHFGGRHAHSSILEPLATTGIVGTVPLVLVVGGGVRRALRRARRDRDSDAVATLAGLTAVVVHGAFDWALVYTSAAIPIALLLGLAWRDLPTGADALSRVEGQRGADQLLAEVGLGERP